MARARRPQIAGGLYHVTTRGNRRQRIFLNRRDGERFLSVLEVVAKRHGWLCHSYCLMPNHYHLLLETPEANIAAGMHRLNSCFAHWFNTRHDLTGHLFERRYRSVLVETDAHFLELVRYIALNPVRSGLCERPETWSWGSYTWMIGSEPNPLLTTERVVSVFTTRHESALVRLRAFVEDGFPEPDTFTSTGARHGDVAGLDELTL
ncbi:MAG: REP-associated tyrosine transposase [Gaiellaceae bacterium]